MSNENVTIWVQDGEGVHVHKGRGEGDLGGEQSTLSLIVTPSDDSSVDVPISHPQKRMPDTGSEAQHLGTHFLQKPKSGLSGPSV